MISIASMHTSIATIVYICLVARAACSTTSFDLFEANVYELGNRSNVTLLCVAVLRPGVTNSGPYTGRLVDDCREAEGGVAWFFRRRTRCKTVLNPTGVFFPATRNVTEREALAFLNNVSSPMRGLWLLTNTSEETFAESKIQSLYDFRLRKIDHVESFFKVSTVVLFFIAVLTETLAVFLSGQTQRPDLKVTRKEVGFYKQIMAVSLILAISTSALLLVYYWTIPMVYLIKIWAGVLATFSQYSLLDQLVLSRFTANPESKLEQSILFKDRSYAIKLKHVIFIPLSSVLPLLWIIGTSLRDESLIFNVFAQNFCLFLLAAYFGSMLVFSKFWVVILIQAVFLIYDVFFVFLTPLFLSKQKRFIDGPSQSFYVFPNALVQKSESVMEYVAFHLRTLVAFRIPVSGIGLNACDPPNARTRGSFTILGLGDILIPAFLGNYCHLFDSAYNTMPVVTVIFVAAYAFGLGWAFVASFLTMRGQPALLYINPATCAGVLIFVAFRRQLIKFVGGINQ